MLIVIKLVLVLNNIVFVLFCLVIFVIIQVYFLSVHFLVLRFSPLNLCLLLLLICSISFVTPLLDLRMFIAWFTKA